MAMRRPSSRILSRFSIESRRRYYDYFIAHLPPSSPPSSSKSLSQGQSKRSPAYVREIQNSPSAAPTSSIHEAFHHQQQSPTPLNNNLKEKVDTTIVRIPIRSAKSHFGSATDRGGRAYNEDTFQAGTINIPSFARRASNNSLNNSRSEKGDDPQTFYFGIFDGHGGKKCSTFLKEKLHDYIEDAGRQFGIHDCNENTEDRRMKIIALQKGLIEEWRNTVGGYFRRFQPEHFNLPFKSGNILKGDSKDECSLEAILTFAFLKADLDLINTQHTPLTLSRPSTSSVIGVDNDSILNSLPFTSFSSPSETERKETFKIKGGSTASVAIIATPTITPFWDPSTTCELIVCHVGDTRILLSRVSDGLSHAVTSNHHPSSPIESKRLRRFSDPSFITDSFGEERILGLANTRSFGDINAKRAGVSAEPEITRLEIEKEEYAFMVMVSDGVSGTLSDQEIVDVVKECENPEEAAAEVVSFATNVSNSLDMNGDGEVDNATCLVIRLGGWEKRIKGGKGSLGTKEKREYRLKEAENPRNRGRG